MNNLRSVTVIICTFNGSGSISGALNSIFNQAGVGQLFRLAIVVVDNGSTDDTAAIVRTRFTDGKSDIETSIIYEPVKGLASARRAGLLGTTSEFVVFCDDDNELDANYLAEGLRVMNERDRVGAIGGKGVFAADNFEKPTWFAKYQSYFAVGEQLPSEGYANDRGYLWGAGLMIRAEPIRKAYQLGLASIALGRTGSSIISGDDMEMAFWFRLLGYDLWYSPALIFSHRISPERISPASVENLRLSFIRAWDMLRLYYLILVLTNFPQVVRIPAFLFITNAILIFPPIRSERVSRWKESIRKFRTITVKNYRILDDTKLK